MSLFLQIAGALLALVGLASIVAGAPDWAFGLSIGATLIQSGALALVGGLILIGLGFVLATLQEILGRLGAAASAPVARPAIMPPEERPAQRAPATRQAAAPEATGELPQPAGTAEPRVRRERRELPPEPVEDDYANAAEPPRPRRDRPRDAGEVARPRRPGPPAGDEVRPRRPTSPPPELEDDAPPPRRSRVPEPPREQQTEQEPRPREFAPIPTIPQPFGTNESRRVPEPPAPAPEPYVPKSRPAEPAPPSPRPQGAQSPPGSETVVRSGVIGGMAYTLYADGSIEAELPIGTVRFDSIAELQDHVMRTGAEADGDFGEQSR